jgi:hypothetical protein
MADLVTMTVLVIDAVGLARAQGQAGENAPREFFNARVWNA